MTAPNLITENTKYVTATQAINSGRWPFRRSQFYKLVPKNVIVPHTLFEGANPVYNVAEIDAAFEK